MAYRLPTVEVPSAVSVMRRCHESADTPRLTRAGACAGAGAGAGVCAGAAVVREDDAVLACPSTAASIPLPGDVLTHIVTFLSVRFQPLSFVVVAVSRPPPQLLPSSSSQPFDCRRFASTSRDCRDASRSRLTSARRVLELMTTDPKAGLRQAHEDGWCPAGPKASHFLLSLHQVVRPVSIGRAFWTLDRSSGASTDEAWTAARPLADAFMEAGWDFDGVHVVDALRSVLLRTGAPSSAMEMAFFLKAIGRRYLATAVTPRPTSVAGRNFRTLDAVYLTLYASVILNGDLYNPAIKRHARMSRTQFMEVHGSVPLLQYVTPEFLGGVYDSVAQAPLPLRGWKTPTAMAGGTAAVQLRRIRTSMQRAARWVRRTLVG